MAATTEQILEAARKLGQMIAEHPATQRLEDALRRLQQDTESQRALNDYNRHLQKLAEKEARGQPIEVEDKRQLEQLQKAVVMNPTLRELQMVQMDYVDLMRRVDEAMAGAGGLEPPSGAASPIVTPNLSNIAGEV